MQQWYRTGEAAPVASAEPAARSALFSGEGLAELEACMRRLAVGASLDRLGQVVNEHLETGGKRIRGRLAFAAGDGLGVSRETLVPWAAACELLHNATLIHDDVQDGDRVRRGHPTTWVRHGVAQAINAGDLMLMLPFLAVSELEGSAAVRAALHRMVAQHAAETVRGQSLEMELAHTGSNLREAWTRAAMGKTGALMALPVRGVALMSGESEAMAEHLGGLFARLGVVFQLQDDVLDLYGDKGRGERGCDVQEGKYSALVVAHLEREPADGPWLRAVLAAARGTTSDVEIERIARAFRESGALAAVLSEIGATTRAVLSDGALCARPSLREVARELVVLSCRPIAHLVEDMEALAPRVDAVLPVA